MRRMKDERSQSKTDKLFFFNICSDAGRETFIYDKVYNENMQATMQQ